MNKVKLIAIMVLLFCSNLTEMSAKELVVVRPMGDAFEETLRGVEDELKGDYQLKEFILKHQPNEYNSFKKFIMSEKPKLVLLMDNPSIKLMDFFKTENPELFQNMIIFVSMGLNLRNKLKDKEGYFGVSYEVPAYTILTRFRKLTRYPIKKVGVFYRESWSGLRVRGAVTQLAMEKISLIPIDIELYGNTRSDLEKGLKIEMDRIINNQLNFDAFWVLEDSFLINYKNFPELWQPFAEKCSFPILCGLKNLTKEDFKFAAFSASPDHFDLGVQTAQMIQTYESQKTSPTLTKVEYIISVVDNLNFDMLKKLGISSAQEDY